MVTNVNVSQDIKEDIVKKILTIAWIILVAATDIALIKSMGLFSKGNQFNETLFGLTANVKLDVSP